VAFGTVVSVSSYAAWGGDKREGSVTFVVGDFVRDLNTNPPQPGVAMLLDTMRVILPAGGTTQKPTISLNYNTNTALRLYFTASAANDYQFWITIQEITFRGNGTPRPPETVVERLTSISQINTVFYDFRLNNGNPRVDFIIMVTSHNTQVDFLLNTMLIPQ